MPELPEVETVFRGLNPLMKGQKIDEFKVRTERLRYILPEGLEVLMPGRIATELKRIGKYIVITLDDEDLWIMHLGMSGKIKFEQRFNPQKHDHICWRVGSTWAIFHDPRKFGSMEFLKKEDLHMHTVSKLGLEPSDMNIDDFMSVMKSSIDIKTHLLNQRHIAGIGNIYASEALWMAQICPKISANKLTSKQGRKLLTAIQEVLSNAIDAGGTTLRDFKSTSGELGYFKNQLNAYQQDNKSCNHKSCAGRIIRIKQSNRSTFHCDVCQEG